MGMSKGNDKELVFATKNQSKLKEIREILKGSGFFPLSMEEAGIDFDIVEDGATFAENAVIKAKAVALAAGKAALADDSGLEVDYLNKEPGINSARFMGYDTPYEVKNAHILKELEGVPANERGARFVCAIAAAFPDGRVFVEEAVIEGRIADAPRGNSGFGYDPIFYVPEFGCTTAEMTPEQKNAISHRGKAMGQMRERLLRIEDNI